MSELQIQMGRTECVLFILAGTFLAALTVRVFLFELRSSLTISWSRFWTVGPICMALVGYSAYSLLGEAPHKEAAPVHSQPQPPPEKAPAPVPDPNQATISELETRLKDLRNQEAALAKRIDSLRNGTEAGTRTNAKPEPAVKASPPRRHPALLGGALIQGIMLILGLGLFFLAGDLGNLRASLRFLAWGVNRGGRKTENMKKLEEISRKIQSGEYQSALDLSESVQTLSLEKPDVLDFLFLTSYCRIQIIQSSLPKTKSSEPSVAPQELVIRKAMQETAAKDLAELLEQAPRMSEAEYLLAVCEALMGEHAPALERFRRTEPLLNSQAMDFKNMKSFCLLALAGQLAEEQKLEATTPYFDEVVKLGVQHEMIPGILVSARMKEVQTNMANRDFAKCRAGLQAMREFKVPDPNQTRVIQAMTHAMEVQVELSARESKEGQRIAADFLAKWTPADMPKPEEHAADEFLFPAVRPEDLVLKPHVFRAICFAECVFRMQKSLQENKWPDNSQSRSLADCLLRGLQFEPRNREALACVGALFYVFFRDRREKAIAWMEAARVLGIEHGFLNLLIERYHGKNEQRQTALESFMNLSARIMYDPVSSIGLKDLLAREFGQFHEFSPLLIDLESASVFEEKGQTLQAIVDTGKYISGLAMQMEQGGAREEAARLRVLGEEYSQVVKSLEQSLGKIAALESGVIVEIGNQLFR